LQQDIIYCILLPPESTVIKIKYQSSANIYRVNYSGIRLNSQRGCHCCGGQGFKP